MVAEVYSSLNTEQIHEKSLSSRQLCEDHMILGLFILRCFVGRLLRWSLAAFRGFFGIASGLAVMFLVVVASVFFVCELSNHQ